MWTERPSAQSLNANWAQNISISKTTATLHLQIWGDSGDDRMTFDKHHLSGSDLLLLSRDSYRSAEW